MPDKHRAGLAQLAHDRGVVSRGEALKDLRRTGTVLAADEQVILDRDRDAGERPDVFAPSEPGVDIFRLPKRLLVKYFVERLDLRLDQLNPVEVGGCYRLGA